MRAGSFAAGPAQAKQEAEAALTELRCHKLALDEHAIVAVTDPAGRILYANDRFCEISKYTLEELLGQDHRIVNSRFHPRRVLADDVADRVSQGKSGGRKSAIAPKTALIYWVDTTIVPFKDSQGRITQHVAIRADITQRKATEASLAEREQQFRTLVNNIPGIPYRCLNDEHWTMLFISDAVERSDRRILLVDFI